MMSGVFLPSLGFRGLFELALGGLFLPNAARGCSSSGEKRTGRVFGSSCIRRGLALKAINIVVKEDALYGIMSIATRVVVQNTIGQGTSSSEMSPRSRG